MYMYIVHKLWSGMLYLVEILFSCSNSPLSLFMGFIEVVCLLSTVLEREREREREEGSERERGGREGERERGRERVREREVVSIPPA